MAAGKFYSTMPLVQKLTLSLNISIDNTKGRQIHQPLCFNNPAFPFCTISGLRAILILYQQ